MEFLGCYIPPADGGGRWSRPPAAPARKGEGGGARRREDRGGARWRRERRARVRSGAGGMGEREGEGDSWEGAVGRVKGKRVTSGPRMWLLE
jgi:hypothetical protein